MSRTLPLTMLARLKTQKNLPKLMRTKNLSKGNKRKTSKKAALT